jgi:GT2 family glycosyltransferase
VHAGETKGDGKETVTVSRQRLSGSDGTDGMSSVVALVLTFRRPPLATKLVRSLVSDEGFSPDKILLVVNGEGGIDDPELVEQVRMLHLPINLGPAGGLREGLLRIAETMPCDWIYVCEDDVPLAHLRKPRARELVAAIEEYEGAPGGRAIGAVTGWGRHLDLETGQTFVHTMSRDEGRFQEIDLAGWGATLMSRRVIDAGVLPDADFFFGYEDWDFWLRMRSAGFRLMLDSDALRPEIYGNRRGFIRQESLNGIAWRGYYEARNFLELRRRYGNPAWTRHHLIRSARRMKSAHSWPRRAAIAAGLVDGWRGHLGRNPRFLDQGLVRSGANSPPRRLRALLWPIPSDRRRMQPEATESTQPDERGARSRGLPLV